MKIANELPPTMNGKMRPKFKHLRFKSEATFEVWLKKHTSKVLHLRDNGQDLLTLHLHSSGEIIHANAQTGIWNGRFVKDIEVGLPISMFLQGEWKQMDFEVEKIEE